MYQRVNRWCHISTLCHPNPDIGRVNRGWIAGWQSRAETNTAVDSKGNTSGTFWDWQRGKTVPVVQSLPNLHQVSGIKGSISALDFHVWLNHPGQCVRCWTKWILSKKRSYKKKKKNPRLSAVLRRFLMAKEESVPCLIKTPL